MANSWNQSNQPYQQGQAAQQRIAGPQRLQITAGNEKQGENKSGSNYQRFGNQNRFGNHSKDNRFQGRQPQAAYVEDEESDKENEDIHSAEPEVEYNQM
jgi:hypothetical protein